MTGLVAATYAPMLSDGSLNLEMISKYSDFLKYNDLKGAFINGSTGDFVSLSTMERKELIEAWAEHKSSNFYLTNQVGHTSLREAMDLAKHSDGLVDAICALPPYYFKPKTLDSLAYYCKMIAQSAPSTPFYYYHIPILTGADFQMLEFLKIVEKQIPNFKGIKFSKFDPKDFIACKNFSNERFEILFGVDEMLSSSLEFGAKGWVGSTYNHLAPLYKKIVSNHHKNKVDRANELQSLAVLFVQQLDALKGFNGAGKSFMRLFGLDMGPSRYPHHTMTNQELINVLEKFKEKNLFSMFSEGFSENYLNKNYSKIQ